MKIKLVDPDPDPWYYQEAGGWKQVLDMHDYILVVEGKYVQMMTIYLLYNNDQTGLEKLYETFNEHVREAIDMIWKTKGQEKKYAQLLSGGPHYRRWN